MKKTFERLAVRTLLPIYFVVAATGAASGQTGVKYLQLNQSIPEFKFNKVQYGTSQQFSTRELNGKPTVLYFFSINCASSFRHFQEIYEVYAANRNDLNILLVGIDLRDKIQEHYEVYRRKYNLKLPIAFDSVFYKRYSIRAVPNVVWIDKSGIVKAITNVLDKEYVRKFIAGEIFDFIDYSAEGKSKWRKFDVNSPFLIGGNGGVDTAFSQRSLFTEWKIGMPNEMPWAEPNKDPLEGIKYLQVIGRELGDLYRIAYFGKTYRWHYGDSANGNYHYSPILEIKDKSKFESDYSLGKNLFCYSQILPQERRNPREMREVLKRDLKNFLGYDVTIEYREMPYLSLTLSRDARSALITKGGDRKKSTSSLTHINSINRPISDVLTFLSYNLGLVETDRPIVDETGMEGNIDIQFNAIMTDLDDVKRALREKGLLLVEKKKRMKCIVIRESKQKE